MPLASGEHFRVYASVAAYKHKGLIQLLVNNVLHFVDPWKLALHTSDGSASAQELQFVRPNVVLHNPQHIHVHSNHQAQVFAIHLSNFAMLEALPEHEQPKGMDRMLLVPGNSVFFRPCTGLLAKSPMSFGIASFSDVGPERWGASEYWIPPAVDMGRKMSRPVVVRAEPGGHPLRSCESVPEGGPQEVSPQSLHPEAAKVKAEMRWATRLEPAPSAAWSTFVEQVRQRNDSALFAAMACTKNHFHRGFLQFATSRAANETAGFIRQAPIGIQSHEGAWYPAQLVKEVLRAVNGTVLSSANLTRGCPHAGWCNMEETVLPTVAWQRYPHLSARAPLSLIARALQPATCGKLNDSSCEVSTCHSKFNSLAMLLAFVRQPHKPAADRNWCGLKLAADGPMEDNTQALLQAIQSRHIHTHTHKQPAWSLGSSEGKQFGVDPPIQCWEKGFWQVALRS